MPAKRVILIGRTHPTASFYRYALWADVPAGNQIAYRNPAAVSACANATPAELQAIRDGLVVEQTGEYQADSTSMGSMQSLLEAEWTTFQNTITAQNLWADYGRFWDGAAWQVSPGVPMVGMKESPEPSPPTFFALTPLSAFGANKFHLVMHNNGGTLGQSLLLKVRAVIWQPGPAVVVGATGGLFTLRRRTAPATPPSGAGSFAATALDSATPLPSAVVCYNGPAVSPAGGTATTINEITPQPDETKVSTADAPTLAGQDDFGGQIVYRQLPNTRPLTIRSGETLELQQSATAGLGNGRALVVFTVG